ncbi:MAG: ATP-binding protein [Paracoccus sp. (in: a-proteobacteria)]|nr:ATP-binding protein [Paracoccus sp. (in: a-proteobacteria)]
MSEAPRPPGRFSLRTSLRLSLQFAFLYSILSALVFAMAYWFTNNEVGGWVRDQMHGDAKTLSRIWKTDGDDALIANIDALSKVSFENSRIYQLSDAQGVVVSGNITQSFEAALPPKIDADALLLTQRAHDEVEIYWMHDTRIGPYRLIQGTGDHIVAELLEALGGSLVAGYMLVIGLGLIVGVRVGRITEARITAISETLQQVSDGQLDARIPDAHLARDDVSRVADEVNRMLDQITRLVESQEQISNDIAHDMRTPLQRLRQRLETIVDDPENAGPRAEAALVQTEEIIATFNALLRIAQIEADSRQERFEQVDLNQIADLITDAYAPSAEDKGLVLATELSVMPANVLGDRGLLVQMVSNLVENAIHHCPFGTSITVQTAVLPTGIMLHVRDTGLGIAPDQRELVFRRFYRSDQSRHTRGNGLGLALVKAITEMHDATVTISDNNPGADIAVLFPPQG